MREDDTRGDTEEKVETRDERAAIFCQLTRRTFIQQLYNNLNEANNFTHKY